MERNRKTFVYALAVSVLAVLALTVFAPRASAFSGHVPGAENGVGSLPVLCAQSLSRSAALGGERRYFSRREIPPQEERILCLSKIFAAEQLLLEKREKREKNPVFAVVNPEPAANVKTPAGVLLEFESDTPIILLLPTQIAVRK